MDLSICIVNWNRYDLLARCLDSIYSHPQDLAFEVIVVDNGSQDGSPEQIKRYYPQVRLIGNDQNLGFAQANNQALRISHGRYALLLNNDTIVCDQALSIMVRRMDRMPATAVVTCKVFPSLEAAEPMISFGDRFPSWKVLFLNDLVCLTGLRKFFPHNRWIQGCVWTGHNPDRFQEVAQVTGACMMVRRKAFEQVGLLDERFFMYMEETDWCYRFHKAGWKICYIPEAAIIHFCEGSSRLRDDRDRLYYQSISYFLKKHYGAGALWGYHLQEWLLFHWLRKAHRFIKGQHQAQAFNC